MESLRHLPEATNSKYFFSRYFFPLPPWFPCFCQLHHSLTHELNCWLIFDITLSLHQAPNSHHKHPPFLYAFPCPLHSFRSSSHAPWSTVLGHRLFPSWDDRALTVHTSPPASQIYSPCAHLPFWANPSLMVPPFLPLSDGRAPKPTSPWPLPFTLQLECHALQFHSKVELCLLSEHPGRGNLVLGASVGSRIWSTCFLGDLWPLARPPHQHWLPSDRHSTCHLGLLTTCKLALLLFLLVTPWSLLPGAVTVCVKASWEPRAHLLVSFSVWCTSTPTSTFQ